MQRISVKKAKNVMKNILRGCRKSLVVNGTIITTVITALFFFWLLLLLVCALVFSVITLYIFFCSIRVCVLEETSCFFSKKVRYLLLISIAIIFSKTIMLVIPRPAIQRRIQNKQIAFPLIIFIFHLFYFFVVICLFLYCFSPF